MEAAHATPYILITSPEKRSGKTRVLEVSELIVASPLRTDSISPAALFRVIQQERPTLLVDEIDATFGAQEREALRGLINGGHTRGGQAVRVSGEGSRMQVQRFETFGPKAFAGIDNRRFPETIRDRAIVIRLRRRTGGGPRFRVRHVAAEVKPLRDAAESWAAGAVELLRDAEPQLPQALDDRALDLWEPLIAIAELAGGDWPERARLAAVELAGERSEDESAGVRCLRDIRAFFDRVGDSSVASGDLVAELKTGWMSRPGDRCAMGRDLMRGHWLAKLRPYGIRRPCRPSADWPQPEGLSADRCSRTPGSGTCMPPRRRWRHSVTAASTSESRIARAPEEVSERAGAQIWLWKANVTL